MKLAFKLALAILPGAALIITAAAVLDLRRDRVDFDADQRSDDLAIVRVLAASVGIVWEDGGEARAKAVLAKAHKLEARFRLRWVDLRGEASALSVAEREAVQRGDVVLWHPVGDLPGWLHALSPVRAHGAVVGAIDLSEAPTDLRAHVWRTIRATVLTTLALSASMLLVTLLIGAWVVGRPVAALIEQARRVAAGDLRARVIPQQRDELGELTRELNKMLDRLESASVEVLASTRQRFAALEQLRHAERLSTVGRLASSVAHELGTPLNVVAGRARLILEEEPQAGTHATIVIEQAERMTKIIRQLLDYARRQPAQKEEQNLNVLITKVLSILGTLATKRRVLLRFSCELSDAFVVADSTQVQQALINLILNGIQATAAEGTIDVILRMAQARRPQTLREATEEEAYFEISVQDHGLGMSPEILARVFEPFFTTKPVGEATGLGLSVAYDIVEEHGGWIRAESEPGRGSCFSMFLPRRPA